MTDVVSNIELRFGFPSTKEKEDFISKKAIEYDVSIEKVLLVEFEYLFKDVWMKEGRENIFELLFLVVAGEVAEFPDVRFGTYLHNGYRFPKVIIFGDYLNVKNSDKRIWLNDDMANQIGNELDLNFEYEYVEFVRVKQ